MLHYEKGIEWLRMAMRGYLIELLVILDFYCVEDA